MNLIIVYTTLNRGKNLLKFYLFRIIHIDTTRIKSYNMQCHMHLDESRINPFGLSLDFMTSGD